jgi:hypothetical protein
MSTPGALYGSVIGPRMSLRTTVLNGGNTTFAMAAQNICWCVRFTAQSTKDIKSVRLRWATITSGGAVNLRIETIDATSGKPTGNLYDAADGADAEYSITGGTDLTAGIHTYTFATTPVTGLTVGAEYAIVLITTTAGTAHTLDSHVAHSVTMASPCAVLTATDGTTRANLAEVSTAIPCVSLIMDDDTEECVQFNPYTSTMTQTYFSGTAAIAGKITLDAPAVIAGVVFYARRQGTPTVDLRVRVFLGSSVVSGTTVTIDKDTAALWSGNGKICHAMFPTPVTLSAGTYYIALDSAGSAGNDFYTSSSANLHANVESSGIGWATTTDITAGTITWTAVTDKLAYFGMLLDSIPAPDFPEVGNVTEDDTVNGATGTYHEATVAEVQDGVFFGAASALEGTYAGGGGGTTVIVVED